MHHRARSRSAARPALLATLFWGLLVAHVPAVLGADGAPAAAAPPTPTPEAQQAALIELLQALRDRGAISQEAYELLRSLMVPPAQPVQPIPAPVPPAKQPADKWYERLNLGGYTQLRYTEQLDTAADALNVPADRSVNETESFIIRRGRLKLSGDVGKHLFLYCQIDLSGTLGGGGDFVLQARDLYADIFLDKTQDFRLRVGLSKVPFGWVNLQSSQNRGPMERADAINSAAEGERDTGVYFMYAPAEVRGRFKELVKSGLKGSGDYGMLTLGGYTGQGPNRSDLNGELHWVGRIAYPFKLGGGQFLELGLHGYAGRFVPSTQAVTVNGASVTPAFAPDGVTDRRVGLMAVLFPQPFGIEAEWNTGRGPQLSPDFTTIDDATLRGGYLQANYRLGSEGGEFFVFARWQDFEGGRKFGRNAPDETVRELDLGVELSPWPELEITLMVTHTFERTNTRDFPYATVEDADRLGIQAQWNY